MGLEDRDWYRAASKRSYWREANRSVAGGRRSSTSRSVGVAALASLAILVVGVAVERTTSYNPFAVVIHQSRDAPPVQVPPSHKAPADDATVRVRWRATDLARAATRGRICLNNSLRGRVCAAFVEGERPADSLARKLRALGVRVESAS